MSWRYDLSSLKEYINKLELDVASAKDKIKKLKQTVECLEKDRGVCI